MGGQSLMGNSFLSVPPCLWLTAHSGGCISVWLMDWIAAMDLPPAVNHRQGRLNGELISESSFRFTMPIIDIAQQWVDFKPLLDLMAAMDSPTAILCKSNVKNWWNKSLGSPSGSTLGSLHGAIPYEHSILSASIDNTLNEFSKMCFALKRKTPSP